jgi:hypothetical protein
MTHEEQRAAHAEEALGYFAEGLDDNPVLSCLDALAVDLRVLELAVEADTSTHEENTYLVYSALGRLVARVKAIRALHAKLSEKARVTQ